MLDTDAIAALSALAHGHRLRIFRLLMHDAPAGRSAGELAGLLDIPPSTLSEHLARLRRAGLIRARRDRTRIFYAADLDGTRDLLGFLVRDCCQGRPELCGFGQVEGQAAACARDDNGGRPDGRLASATGR